MFTFSGYILFWQVLVSDTRTLFLTGDPPPQTREMQRSKGAKKTKTGMGTKKWWKDRLNCRKAERLESSYTPQRAMYWWLTKTWENGNENEWMVWITKQKKKKTSRRERVYVCWCMHIYTVYSTNTTLTMDRFVCSATAVCVEGDQTLSNPYQTELQQPCLGPHPLVKAPVLVSAKAKGATQRNVHLATRLVDSSPPTDCLCSGLNAAWLKLKRIQRHWNESSLACGHLHSHPVWG